MKITEGSDTSELIPHYLARAIRRMQDAKDGEERGDPVAATHREHAMRDCDSVRTMLEASA